MPVLFGGHVGCRKGLGGGRGSELVTRRLGRAGRGSASGERAGSCKGRRARGWESKFSGTLRLRGASSGREEGRGDRGGAGSRTGGQQLAAEQEGLERDNAPVFRPTARARPDLQPPARCPPVCVQDGEAAAVLPAYDEHRRAGVPGRRVQGVRLLEPATDAAPHAVVEGFARKSDLRSHIAGPAPRAPSLLVDGPRRLVCNLDDRPGGQDSRPTRAEFLAGFRQPAGGSSASG